MTMIGFRQTHCRGLTALKLTLFMSLVTKSILARNPPITKRYSADPSAHVWPGSENQLWIYASHDQDDAEDMASMREYYVYSTYDMVRRDAHRSIDVYNQRKQVSWTSYDRAFHLNNASWALNKVGVCVWC